MKYFSYGLRRVYRAFAYLSIALLLIAQNLIVANVFAQPYANAKHSYNDSKKYHNDQLVIKVNQSAELDISESNSFKSKSNSLDSNGKANKLNQILVDSGKSKLTRITKPNQTNTIISNRFNDALSEYFVVNIAPQSNVDQMIGKIALLDSVETVYPVSKSAPSPTVNNYTSLQKYLNSAPEGIGSNYAKTVPGGNGSAVRIIDLEYSWNINHEDLARAVNTKANNGTPADPFNDNNHGTAVIGELISTDNSYGVTGAVSGAQLSLVNTYNQERGWDIVGALQVAASRAVPGDVIIIEQQTWAPSNIGGYAPVEWEPAIYDAIKALTTNGINVVEPAANSGHNLNDTSIWGSTFPMGKPSSGAVIVGAGSACSAPLRSRLSFSNHGSRVNLQGYGECVTTTGYGYLG